MILHDYISPLQDIYANSNREYRRLELTRLMSESRRIMRQHLMKSTTVEEMVDYLMQSDTVRRVNQFDLRHWIKTGHRIAKGLKRVLGSVPEPSIVLYPGLRRVNGKVIDIDGRPALTLSPDFGFFSGHNLDVVLAHEYAHYLRSRLAGVRFKALMPFYQRLFEEGFACYVTVKVLPRVPISTTFMANLHRRIGLNDPSGGYIRWCRRHIGDMAGEALKVLPSKEWQPAIRFFDCGRYEGDDTPVRVGYYLGYAMIQHACKEIPCSEMVSMRATRRMVRQWLEEMT
jgi:hypothetical protein